MRRKSIEAARLPGSTGVEFLNIQAYLTQKLDIDAVQNVILNSVGSDFDPLMALKSRTNFGRPNFPKMFASMRDGIFDRTYLSGLEDKMRTTVGVYFRGPSAAGLLLSRTYHSIHRAG